MIDYAAEWKYLAGLHAEIARATGLREDELKAGKALATSVMLDALEGRK
jgi:hypothetical protein